MLTLVIQRAGKKQRMGQDKALMPFLGRPLISRVIERVAPLADEILVTTNRADSYGFLGLPLVPDLMPGRGALGGLYTALASAANPIVALVACDMPFASPNCSLSNATCSRLEGAPDVVIPPGRMKAMDTNRCMPFTVALPVCRPSLPRWGPPGSGSSSPGSHR